MKTIEELSDAELSQINGRGWVCGTKDSKGRILGSKGRVYEIPERRFVMADQALGFAGKSVVEFGCLEGCHTMSIAKAARSVLGIDYQQGNLDKSRIRCELYGAETATFALVDLERGVPPPADLYFHSGVLYHLQDPVTHLARIAPLCRELFLDTHHTNAANSTYKAAVDGKEYPCRIYGEPKHPRAGSAGMSRWIPLELLTTILKKHFKSVRILRDENERNGPRVTIAAKKSL